VPSDVPLPPQTISRVAQLSIGAESSGAELIPNRPNTPILHLHPWTKISAGKPVCGDVLQKYRLATIFNYYIVHHADTELN
jgi:hypothetical protein